MSEKKPEVGETKLEVLGRLPSQVDVRVSCCAADGNVFGLASWDCKLTLWNMTTMKLQAHCDGHFGKIYGLCISGQRVLSVAMDGKLRGFDSTTGEIKHSTNLRSSWMMSCGLSPDLKYMGSGGLDNTITMYEVATGNEVYQLDHDGYVSCMKFTSDGKHLYSSTGGGVIKHWDVATTNPVLLHTLGPNPGHSSDVMEIVLSHDNTRLYSASCDATVIEWDISGESPVVLRTFLKAHNQADVNAVGLSPDSKLLYAGGDSGILYEIDLAPSSTSTGPRRMTSPLLDVDGGGINSIVVLDHLLIVGTNRGAFVVNRAEKPEAFTAEDLSPKLGSWLPDTLVDLVWSYLNVSQHPNIDALRASLVVSALEDDSSSSDSDF